MILLHTYYSKPDLNFDCPFIPIHEYILGEESFNLTSRLKTHFHANWVTINIYKSIIKKLLKLKKVVGICFYSKVDVIWFYNTKKLFYVLLSSLISHNEKVWRNCKDYHETMERGLWSSLLIWSIISPLKYYSRTIRIVTIKLTNFWIVTI